MPHTAKELGALGEQVAASYLESHGYAIVARNFTARWAELDIIARKDKTLVFVEVKTRTSYSHGAPHEAITFRKLQHLKRSINLFLLQNPHHNLKLQIDVISVMLSPSGELQSLKQYEHIW